jgi:hypothetical protein
MLQGKGMFIWKINEAERSITELVAKAKVANMSHLLFKVANGYAPYNIVDADGGQAYSYDGIDLAMQLADECRAQGIEPWGWHYVYGDHPEQEAMMAVNRIQELGLAGFVVNAEGHYKGKANSVAETYMGRLPKEIPTALSSYRYPSLHRELPWEGFLKYCDFVMPQVYWIGGEPVSQIEETLLDYDVLLDDLDMYVPVFPTGTVYEHKSGNYTWKPTKQQVIDFMTEVKRLGLPGFNLYRWGEMKLLGFWPIVRDFEWVVEEPTPEPSLEFLSKRIDTLEQGQMEITEDIMKVEKEVSDLRNNLETDITNLQDSLARTQAKQREIAEDIVDIRAQEKVTKENIENLLLRFEATNLAIDYLEDRVDKLEPKPTWWEKFFQRGT